MKRVMHGLIILTLLGSFGLAQQAQERGITFGNITLQYDKLRSTQRRKDNTITVEVEGTRQNPVVVNAPDQFFTMSSLKMQAVLTTNEQGQFILQSAQSEGQVVFRYLRKEPFSRVDATANRATYNAQTETLVVSGDVVVKAEDDFYLIEWRDNEEMTLYLGEEEQRVVATGREQGGTRRGTMTITPKERPKQ